MTSRSYPEPNPQHTPTSSTKGASRVDVAVVGAGIIGLGIAWSLVRSGRSVCVIDPDPAMGATRAAAGMLAPVSEYHHQEEELLGLTLRSALLYPEFVRTLADGGRETGYLTTETLLVGIDAGDRQALRDLYDKQLSQGLPILPMTIRELRTQEPLLSPRLSAGYRAADDRQVDPRILSASLLDALADPDAHSGKTSFERRPAKGLLHERADDSSSRVVGIQFDDGDTLTADEVIVANGTAAGDLHGLPRGLSMPLRPVFGDIIRITVPGTLRPLLHATIRAAVHGNSVYIVPRSDGTAVVGATQRETGTAGVSSRGIFELLRDAQDVVPAVAEADIAEIMARARPATPDNKPLLGRVRHPDGSNIAGLIIATGFFRHGVLLTPVAAEICQRLVEGPDDTQWAPFRPDRFRLTSTSPKEHQ
ncbi:glycine oxidase ThiO [Microbacterium sp. HA-8]|uniref:glycine oxidase ThiO n=1 Tax=Microbacterium sp. HA-8 TaxID=3234200 RepID=UPI0038F79262